LNDTTKKSGAGFWSALARKLSSARESLATGLSGVLGAGRKLDSALFEELESALLAADVGLPTTTLLLQALQARTQREQIENLSSVRGHLRQLLLDIVRPVNAPFVLSAAGRPLVIMVVGVNGVGKTTSVAKLAYRLKTEGHSVLLAAADTFRAAAVEQLKSWGERLTVPVIAQAPGADAAAVAHDALNAATARGTDTLIVDTAGRQHVNTALMDELKKIKRVLQKIEPAAPHQVWLVLDAGTGQNALSQLKFFNDAVGVTGLILTKLDGTAKGGVLLALAHQFKKPIYFVGTGEALEDLAPFDAEAFVNALLPEAPA
jgi:fused signal recognition particle receptor